MHVVFADYREYFHYAVSFDLNFCNKQSLDVMFFLLISIRPCMHMSQIIFVVTIAAKEIPTKKHRTKFQYYSKYY